jgi:hypothetical protein
MLNAATNGRTSTLNSWKEIACYLGRGVRTVQRWENELQLPVHRIGSSERSPVFAFKTELDNWVRRQAGNGREFPQVAIEEDKATRPHHLQVAFRVLERSSQLTSEALGLLARQRAHTKVLREQVERMAHLLPNVAKIGSSAAPLNGRRAGQTPLRQAPPRHPRGKAVSAART